MRFENIYELLEEQVNRCIEPIVENLCREFHSSKKLKVHLDNIRREMCSHITKLLGYGEVNISCLKKVAIANNAKFQLISNSKYTEPIGENIGYYQH